MLDCSLFAALVPFPWTLCTILNSVCNLLSREGKKVIQRHVGPCWLCQLDGVACVDLMPPCLLHIINNTGPQLRPYTQIVAVILSHHKKAVDIKIRYWLDIYAMMLLWCLEIQLLKRILRPQLFKAWLGISVCVHLQLTTKRFQHENRALAGNQRMLLCHE